MRTTGPAKGQFLDRKYEHKPWSKLFKDRAEELCKEHEDPVALRARKDLKVTTKAGTLIAKVIGKRVRLRLKNKAYSCHRTPENLTFPKDLREWKTHWGTRIMCSICDGPALYDCTACRTCNSIAHRLCVAEQFTSMQSHLSQLSSPFSISNNSNPHAEAEETKFAHDEGEDDEEDALFGGDSPSVYADHFDTTMQALGMDEFTCLECQRAYSDDVEYFERLKVQLFTARRYILALRLVCRRILGYVERKRFKTLRRGLIFIQAAIRKRRAKRVFYHWRRSQMRVIVIDLLHLPPQALQLNDLVVLTVVDTMKAQQLFRFDKTASKAAEEGFLIPGITAHMTLVLTICRVEEHTAGTVYVVTQQCQLSLRDIDSFLDRLSYSLPFGKRIWWLPQDAKKELTYRVVAEKTGGIVPSHGGAGAPSAKAEAKADAKIGGKAGGVDAGMSSSSLSPAPAPAAAESKHTASPKASPRSALLTNPEAAASASEDKDKAVGGQLMRVLYYPQNPISSVTFMVSGPPLDVLRTPAVTDPHLLARTAARKASSDSEEKKLDTRDSGPQGRATRWWLCLNNLRLYFFQNYGDAKPRFISDLTDAQVGVDPIYTKGNVIFILHRDSRLWLIELSDSSCAEKVAFAVHESQKAQRTKGGSIFMRTADVRVRRSFGFDVDVL